MKCDIIIPVYKAPEWVKLCVYALFVNTDPNLINKVYLINDCDDIFTTNCLRNLKSKYGSKIILKQNKQNLGFIKTCNFGLKLSTAEYVLLLNSDCLLSKNAVEKLINHLKTNPKIGLICPLANNAANLTLPIPEGWSYTQINSLLEENFLGQNFDACTVVGNCLMITRECIKKTGILDEAYGTGYGEETDYQFKAMAKGFEAKVAIDTYVFHKAEASFGTSKEKQARLQKNRNLFFSRWSDQYNSELKKYNRNDPIKYIHSHLPKKAWSPKVKTLFYIDGIVQNAGGVHTVVDIVNYLTINSQKVNILFNLKYPYQENILFTPIPASKADNIECEQIISTVWKTAFEARTIANQKNAHLFSFVQGYESYFENGTKYGAVELSYKLSDSILTVSKYLEQELRDTFNKNSFVISNGINSDLLCQGSISPKNPSATVITIIMRNNTMKGDWLLMDIIKRLGKLNYRLQINVISVEKKISLPSINNDKVEINLLTGPQDRSTVYQLLQKSDIYVDASLSEGFGLTALEAMASGCIPVVSNSMGINEYIKNNENGYIIEKINDPDLYIKEIKKLITDKRIANSISQNGIATARKYDFDKTIPQYITFLNNPPLRNDSLILSETEQKIIADMEQQHNQHARRIGFFRILQKVTPKPIKKVAAKVINKLYNYINR